MVVRACILEKREIIEFDIFFERTRHNKQKTCDKNKKVRKGENKEREKKKKKLNIAFFLICFLFDFCFWPFSFCYFWLF